MPRKPENLNSNKIQKRAPNSNSFDSKRKEILKRKSSLPATPHGENLVLCIAKIRFALRLYPMHTRHPRGFVFYGRAVFFCYLSHHPYSATFALYRHARTHTLLPSVCWSSAPAKTSALSAKKQLTKKLNNFGWIQRPVTPPEQLVHWKLHSPHCILDSIVTLAVTTLPRRGPTTTDRVATHILIVLGTLQTCPFSRIRSSVLYHFDVLNVDSWNCSTPSSSPWFFISTLLLLYLKKAFLCIVFNRLIYWNVVTHRKQ